MIFIAVAGDYTVHVVCSDSTEETPADNSESVMIHIQYGTEIILTRSVYKH